MWLCPTVCISHCPCDRCRTYRVLHRGIISRSRYSAVVCRRRRTQGYSRCITLACIGRYINNISRTRDRRVLCVYYRDRLIACIGPAVNISHCPCDRCRTYRVLHRGIISRSRYSAVVCRRRRTQGYSCCITLACIGRYINNISRTRDRRVLCVYYRDRLIACSWSYRLHQSLSM